MLEKLLEQKKKEGKMLSPEAKSAKLEMLKSLKDEMGKDMGKDLANLKKVSVASDSKEGLEEGLEKAKDMISGSGEEMSEGMEEESTEESSEPSEEMMMSAYAKDPSKENLEALMACLEKKKQEMV